MCIQVCDVKIFFFPSLRFGTFARRPVFTQWPDTQTLLLKSNVRQRNLRLVLLHQTDYILINMWPHEREMDEYLFKCYYLLEHSPCAACQCVRSCVFMSSVKSCGHMMKWASTCQHSDSGSTLQWQQLISLYINLQSTRLLQGSRK